MKQNFVRLSTRAKSVSLRTLALVMGLVMLLSAVGVGSTLSAYAVSADESTQSGALLAAAVVGGDIADQIAQFKAPVIAEANAALRGDKADLADTAASADFAAIGYSSNSGYVKGDWDNYAEHLISGNGYTIHLDADKDYKFCFKSPENNDHFKKEVTISGSVTKYDFPKDGKSDATLHTTVAGDYTFKFNSWDGGHTSMRVDITFPEDTTPDTWTVVGSATGSNEGGQQDALFGFSWDPTLTTNDMTDNNGTWTWTKSNVTLSAGTITYKVAKNHAWDTTVPASANATQTVSDAGTYNVTVTYDGTNVSMALEPVAKSTLTVQSNIEHATVTATYNGTTAQEGGTISNIPQGATVNVSVTPDTGYQCTGITCTPSATTSGSMYSFTLTMPGQDTTVNANIDTVTLKKIYFNNSYTLYGSVYAYVYDKSGNKKTYEYLGAYPGTTMNKLENSNIWYIEVPSDVDYVQFVSGEGYTTEELTIPWGNAYPKYTAPYNKEAPTEANGGTWGNYIYGGNNDKRTNEYTVSDGTTMSASNLFTGITATMYDYYVDGEASGGNWLSDIGSDEFTWTTDGWKWNPYSTLNTAISSYADATSQPKYGVTYPLYFGNLNTENGGPGLVSGYYNWNLNANNSISLSKSYNAVTGLSGKSLANSTIHYYKSGATNENGAPMAMFDEDFLSGENSENKALATILRTSSFPVRQETVRTIYCSVANISSWWRNDNNEIFAYVWNGSNNLKIAGVIEGSTVKFQIPSSYTNLIFYRSDKAEGDWNNKTPDLTIPTSSNLYTIHSKFDKDSSGQWSTKSGTTANSTFTYYEYDSSNGRDNAYITDINKTNKTAKINYYTDKKVKSANSIYGFFPFDYNGYNSHLEDTAHDLGFGMKLTIPFTLNANGTLDGTSSGVAQTFDFSGDDDLWVFVDGKLVLDLGGAHGRTTGSIDFKNKTVTAANTESIASGITRNSSFADGFNTNENYVHTMTIYYMERGMFDSNLKFGFSFHAIPNQFWIDKKIRTKDIINAGFYADNEQTGVASNKDDTLSEREGRFISKFEASYQNESFTVEHKYGSTAGATSPASGMKYTIDNDDNTYTTPTEGTYPIKHDLGNAFIGQFTKGQYFNLKETFGNDNKYVYTPVFSVWDQANNNQAITATGDNTAGYTFHFNPTTTVTTGIENTNIKARFENFMVAHTLTLKKEITNATDTTTDFTFQIMFDFDGNYIAYPLYCDVDGVRTKLSNTGEITVKAGQIVEIEEIPEKAKIQVVEVLPDTVAGYRYNGYTLKLGANDATSTAVTKGAQFVMGNNDMTMTFSNKKPDNRYTIKYNYPSYDNLYGQQSYTVSGVFTEKEMDTYLELNNGNLAFKTESLKKGFINRKAPLEDNFMQTLSFADSTIRDSGSGLGWNNGNYSCEVTAKATTDDQVSVSFNLPYNVDTDLVAQASSGRVAKITAHSVGAKKISCFDWYVTSGKSRDDKDGVAPVFVKAPLIIHNGDTPYYFQYWSVKKASSYGMNAAEYTRCYDYEFNLSLFMDTVIEPVYAASWAQTGNPPTTYNMYGRFDPEKQIAADSTNGISIAFLENSRNQYNNNDDGTTNKRDKGAAADVIYSDFLLSFNNFAGKEQLNTRTEGTTKAGLVIEAVGYLEGTNASGFNTSIEYRNETNIPNEETKKAAIKTWVEGGATNANRPGGMAVSQFDVTSLDNKNRIQYYYALNNRQLDATTGNLLNTLQNRYKVFRAYAYIGDVSDNRLTNVKVSDPVYFTIYDMASNGLANNATGR